MAAFQIGALIQLFTISSNMNLYAKRFEFNKDEEIWNFFLKKSKNATFLFNRGFMDYHKDRFVDHSLMIFSDKEKLVACFPANEVDNLTVASHSGLTYGAFIVDSKAKLPVIISVFKEVLKYFHDRSFETIHYKAFPRIYNKLPADEIDYCLFIADAELWRKDTAIVINQEERIAVSKNIQAESKKALKKGFTIEESQAFDMFWEKLLVPNLKERFGVRPVHKIEEIQVLLKKFPESIKLYIAKGAGNTMVAGTVLFLTENVAHCQYIAATDEGRKTGALNLLFVTLIENIMSSKKYFDLGIVNENNGLILNNGLLDWKERMGGRTLSHDFFELKTYRYQNFKLAEKNNV